jgi:hypothetical protein
MRFGTPQLECDFDGGEDRVGRASHGRPVPIHRAEPLCHCPTAIFSISCMALGAFIRAETALERLSLFSA